MHINIQIIQNVQNIKNVQNIQNFQNIKNVQNVQIADKDPLVDRVAVHTNRNILELFKR